MLRDALVADRGLPAAGAGAGPGADHRRADLGAAAGAGGWGASWRGTTRCTWTSRSTPLRCTPSCRPVADTVNAFVRQLKAHAEAQRRFIADAAHQLRTPLALQASQIDYARYTRKHRGEWETRRADMDAMWAALQTSNRRLIAVTNQLLLLAQAENRDASSPLESVDLPAAALHAVEQLAALADRRRIDLGMDLRRRRSRSDGARAAGAARGADHQPAGQRAALHRRRKAGSRSACAARRREHRALGRGQRARHRAGGTRARVRALPSRGAGHRRQRPGPGDRARDRRCLRRRVELADAAQSAHGLRATVRFAAVVE